MNITNLSQPRRCCWMKQRAEEALLRESTRANGKCLLTVTEAQVLLRATGLHPCRPLDSEPRKELGFTHRAPLIGTYPYSDAYHALQPSDRSGTASSCVHAAQTEPLASLLPAASAPAAQAHSAPVPPAAQPVTTKHEPAHEFAPHVSAGVLLPRSSGDTSCR